MTFDEAWAAAQIGDVMVVSNGRPEPPGGLGASRYNVWRSHNFSGPLIEKVEASPRRLRIRDAANPKTVTYDVREDVPHTFEISP